MCQRIIGVSSSFVLFFSLLLASFRMDASEQLGKRIWEGEKHAAFTALIHYDNHFYCAFRNANKHADISGEDCGIIIIIRSEDGVVWERFHTYSEEGYDLRDPQLSITPKGEMMLLTEKVRYDGGFAKTRNSCVSFIKNDGSCSDLTPIVFDTCQDWNWVWNIEWIDGVAWGFCYAPFFAMVKSKDGITFELVQSLDLERNPSEASIIKLNKKQLLALVRTDGVAYLGVYDTDNREWHWKDCDEMIGCPKLLMVNNRVLVVGRSYDGGLKTTLFQYNKKKRCLKRIVSIPGGEDCSYPGIVYYKSNLYITYHKGDINKSDIYLATIKYNNY